MPVARLAPHTMAGVMIERLRGLRGGDGARCLHGLHGDRRAIDEAAHDHGNAEGQQHAERVHLEDADVGDDEGNERAEITEGAGHLHAVEAVLHHGLNDGMLLIVWHHCPLARRDAPQHTVVVRWRRDGFKPAITRGDGALRVVSGKCSPAEVICVKTDTDDLSAG